MDSERGGFRMYEASFKRNTTMTSTDTVASGIGERTVLTWYLRLNTVKRSKRML